MPPNPIPRPPTPHPNPPQPAPCKDPSIVQASISANPKVATPFSSVTITWNVQVLSGPSSDLSAFLNVDDPAFTSVAVGFSGSKAFNLGASLLNSFAIEVTGPYGCLGGTAVAIVDVGLTLASCLTVSVTQAKILSLLVSALNSALGPNVPAATRTFQGGFVFVFDNPSSAQVTINAGSVQFNFDLDVSVPTSVGWAFIHSFGDFHISYSATATVAAVNGAVVVSIIHEETYVTPPTALEVVGWLVAPGAAQIVTNIIDQVMASNIDPLLGSKVNAAIQTAVNNLIQSQTDGLFAVFSAVAVPGKIVLTVCPGQPK